VGWLGWLSWLRYDEQAGMLEVGWLGWPSCASWAGKPGWLLYWLGCPSQLG